MQTGQSVERLDELRRHPWRGGYQQGTRRAGLVGLGQHQDRAGLGSDQGTRCPVPDTQAVFVITIQTSGRHHAQIERGGAQSPNVADQRQQLSQQRCLRGAPTRVVAKPGSQQCHRQVVDPVTSQRTSDTGYQDVRAQAGPGRVDIAADDVGDRPGQRSTIELRGDRDCVDGDAVNEVHGAVDGIDHPPHRAALR